MRFRLDAVVLAAAVALLPQLDAGHQHPWLINTVAGGVGGPGPAGQVLVYPCAVTAATGALYVTDQVLGGAGAPVIRRIGRRTGLLTTVVGDGGPGNSADGTPGTVADLASGCGLAVDHAGNLLFSQQHANVVQMLAAHTGRFYGQPMTAGDVYTIAGNGQAGDRGDGGPALQARLDTPGGLALDAVGNVVIEDSDNNQVRVVAEKTGRFYGQSMKTGDIYTIAGDGRCCYSGDGGPATKSSLALSVINSTPGISLDKSGNLIIADHGNYRIRVVAATSGQFYGQNMTAGDIYTIAGDGSSGDSGDGGPATSAEVASPGGVAVDPAGNIVISQQNDCQARVVAASTGQFYGQAMTAGDIYAIGGAAACASEGVAVDSAGNVITAGSGWLGVIAVATGRFYGQSLRAGQSQAITRTTPPSPTGNGQLARQFQVYAQGVAVNAAGDVLFTQPGQARLVAERSGTVFGRPVRAGRIYTIASGLAAGSFSRPLLGITVDQFGNALVSGRTRVYVIAARNGVFYGRTMRTGHVYVVAGGGTALVSSGIPAKHASLDPSGLAIDRNGNLVIGDYGPHFVEDGANLVEVVAAHSGDFYGQPMKAGYIYTVAGTGSQIGFEGNGVPGTESVIDPLGLATDRAGNIVVADINDNTVRIIAARSGTDFGQRMTAGYIYGLAGSGAAGVSVDAVGNVLIADEGTCRVRMVAAGTGTFYGQAMKADHIYTIAGTGCITHNRTRPGSGKFGDGVVATDAQLLNPLAVAVARSGAVYEVDSFRLRVIEP